MTPPLTRFQGQCNDDNFAFCIRCQYRFHYELLDEKGRCPDCRPDRFEEALSELEHAADLDRTIEILSPEISAVAEEADKRALNQDDSSKQD